MRGAASVLGGLEYPVRVRGKEGLERLIIHGSSKSLLDVRTEDGVKEIHVSRRLLERDIESAYLGEYTAVRFLTPFRALSGGEEVEGMAHRYVLRVLREVVDNILRDYEMGALSMLFKPEYFLFKKLKVKLSVYPPFQRTFWWADPEKGDRELLGLVLRRMERGLDALCGEGILRREGAYYKIDLERGLKMMGRGDILPRPMRIDGELASAVKAFQIGILSPKLLLSDVLGGEREAPRIEPDDHAYITTARGEQRLSTQYRLSSLIMDVIAPNAHGARIDRRGSLFNSTYVVTAEVGGGAKKYFVKRYFAWTDLKWVITKIWTLPLRNFYLAPSTRLGNELFFLSFLREKGFNVPEVIHVDWAEKILVEGFIEGLNLVELWTRRDGWDRRRLTEICGRLLAGLHREGVVMGDSKPDNFIVERGGPAWIVDVEQASFKGSPAWDIAVALLFMGHYVDGRDAEEYAESLITGYLSIGRVEEVEEALDPRYQFVMMPWTPIWTQIRMIETARRILRA